MLVLSIQKRFRNLDNVFRAQAVGFQHLGRSAGTAELVVHADALDRDGTGFRKIAAHRFAQAADDAVLDVYKRQQLIWMIPGFLVTEWTRAV